MTLSLILLAAFLLILFSMFNILKEYERGVVFTLGRFWRVKGPGVIILIPGLQTMMRVDLRTIVMDVPSQDVISRDNVSVKVNAKHIDLNENMVRAIARQAEAERERRAKIINAEGELQASQKLAEAAAVLAKEPQALQLRYLQTAVDINSEKTLIFPVPMDLLATFLNKKN